MDWMDGEGEEELYDVAQPYLVASQCDTINLVRKTVRKNQ